MPDERVQPLAGPGHEQRRAVFDPPLDGAGPFLLAVDDHGLLGGDLEHLLAGDLLVDAGVEPDLGRPGQMLLPAVAVADDEVLARVGDVMDHALETCRPRQTRLGPTITSIVPLGLRTRTRWPSSTT